MTRKKILIKRIRLRPKDDSSVVLVGKIQNGVMEIVLAYGKPKPHQGRKDV